VAKNPGSEIMQNVITRTYPLLEIRPTRLEDDPALVSRDN